LDSDRLRARERAKVQAMIDGINRMTL